MISVVRSGLPAVLYILRFIYMLELYIHMLELHILMFIHMLELRGINMPVWANL